MFQIEQDYISEKNRFSANSFRIEDETQPIYTFTEPSVCTYCFLSNTIGNTNQISQSARRGDIDNQTLLSWNHKSRCINCTKIMVPVKMKEEEQYVT